MKKLLLLLLLSLPLTSEAQMCMRWGLVCKDPPYDGEIILIWIEKGDKQYWDKGFYAEGRFYRALGAENLTPYVTNWMRIYPPASVCPAPTPEPDGGELE